MRCSLLSSVKKILLNSRRSSVQTLGINYLPPLTSADTEYSRYREPLTQTPKDQPGLVLPLPRKCAVCGSYLVGYDRLNVITCGACGALLSVSGRWHTQVGPIKPLTAADRARAQEWAIFRQPKAENKPAQTDD